MAGDSEASKSAADPAAALVVGVVGLGLLGSALVDRLRGAGFCVVGFDIDDSRTGLLEIESAENLGELADRVERVVLCVPSSDVVEQVVEGPGGLIDGSGGDRSLEAIVDCTTGDPRRGAALAERLRSAGLSYVEASISGSSAMVRRGEGVVLVGGKADDVERVDDVLSAIAPIVYVLGPPGAGARAKLASNLVLGLNRLALAEGLAFAERLGLDGGAFLEVLRAGPAHSRALEAKGEKMRSRDFEPQARLAQHLKDVRLILALAADSGASVPATELHRDLLEKAVDGGLGEVDNSAIVEVLRGDTE